MCGPVQSCFWIVIGCLEHRDGVSSILTCLEYSADPNVEFRSCADIRGPRRRVGEDTATAVDGRARRQGGVPSPSEPRLCRSWATVSAYRFRFSSRRQKRPGGKSTKTPPVMTGGQHPILSLLRDTGTPSHQLTVVEQPTRFTGPK